MVKEEKSTLEVPRTCGVDVQPPVFESTIEVAFLVGREAHKVENDGCKIQMSRIMTKSSSWHHSDARKRELSIEVQCLNLERNVLGFHDCGLLSLFALICATTRRVRYTPVAVLLVGDQSMALRRLISNFSLVSRPLFMVVYTTSVFLLSIWR